ncbi:SPFH domain-containing protein [candidate division CSSED10-310 bacterium]|uniref:SPFH domain-containing protein n=1 Tax=candidate division CSSED10-310 bacterium TaxID=2855610 RepID=A0ABV6YV92_UNCC1
MASKSGDKDETTGKSFVGRIIKLFVFLFIIGSIGLACFFQFFSVYVGPGEFAVKQVKIGFWIFKHGIQKKVYDSGYTLKIPKIQEVHVFPRQLQVLDFTSDASQSSKFRHCAKPAYIQTSDGYYVSVDLSIIYRITDPYQVTVTLGPDLVYITEGIVPRAEPILKDTLGELTTEEFYNSPLRVKKAEIAKVKLNVALKDLGMQVDAVLIRYFQYSDQIQKNIEDKKLKDQMVFKNKAEARAATEAANLSKVIEEGEAAVKVKLQEGKAYVTQKNAAREQYIREKNAHADLLVKLADAEKTKLKKQALTGEGAKRLVALQMADVLEGIQIIMIPSDGKQGYNPLDLKQTMDIFEVSD